MKKPFTLHLIRNVEGEEKLKAILPKDGSRGLIIGEDWEVKALRDLLNDYLETGKNNGKIDELHEQLGFEWLTVGDAELLNPEIPGRTIRWAAKHGWIQHSEKNGRDWRFPKMSYMNWVRNRPKPGRKAVIHG